MKIVPCWVLAFLIIVGLVCMAVYNHTSDSLRVEATLKNDYIPLEIEDTNAPSPPSVIEMTYNGKIGVLIIPMARSSVKLGFGF